MAAIHLVERKNNVRRLNDESGDWESGYWVISSETAEGLVGGNLYLHSTQSAPSHFGGSIIGYRVFRDGSGSEIDGRVIFRIRPTLGHKGVTTDRRGWGNEKKLVW